MSADWRFYGTSENGNVLVFFSVAEVRRLPNGHMEVWTEGLTGKQVDSEGTRALKDKVRSDRVVISAMAAASPISKIEKLTQDQIDMIALNEEVANHSDLKPIMRILWEIDCENRMTRSLSIYMVKNGRTGFSEKTGEWMHTPPETNGARLHALVCGNDKSQ